MPYVDRTTLPQEFYDITDAVLLRQAEPQYLHARLVLAAMAAALESPDMLGLNIQGRAFDGTGAPAPSTLPEEWKLNFSNELMLEAVTFVPELGKGPGDTIRLNRPSFGNTTYTEAARLVPAGSVISTTPIAYTTEQVPITLGRYAGPYDTANTRVAPYGVDRFAAKHSVHNLAKLTGMHLNRDFTRWVDHVAVAAFDLGTAVYPTGCVSDATPAVAGDFPMSYSLLSRVNRLMDEGNVPRFPDGRRALVLHPMQLEQLTQDAQYQRQAQFHQDFNVLFKGSYVASIGDWNVFRSTTLSTAPVSSVPVYYGQAFGPGVFGAGMGELPRVAHSTNDDYGEKALLVWLWYAGFACLNSAFLRSVRTS